MKILLVYCHPVPTSFNAAIFTKARETLERAGHDLHIIDLYAENFSPVLTRAEREVYNDHPEQLEAKMPGHIAALRWAEGMVFVFPTWMYGPPAMLKGWLERTWLPGVTFEIAKKKGERTRPLMQHIRRLVVVTTSGSPAWWMFVIRNPGKSLFTRGLRACFNKACKTTWLQLYNMNCVTAGDREKFLGKVERALERL